MMYYHDSPLYSKFREQLKRLSRPLKRGSSLLMFFFLSVMNGVNAGSEEWTFIGPYKGYVDRLIIDPFRPATLYASTNGGLFKSADGANTWESFLHIGGGLAADPRQPLLYVSTGFEFYKSADGGRYWWSPPLDPDLPQWQYPYSFWMDSTPPVTLYIYAGSYETWPSTPELYVSGDRGDTWVPFYRDEPEYTAFFEKPHALKKSFISAGNIQMYADGTMVWKRIDGGSWIALETPAASSITQFALCQGCYLFGKAQFAAALSILQTGRKYPGHPLSSQIKAAAADISGASYIQKRELHSHAGSDR
ncbi:MAG: hypothetical protein GY862_00035 [Gammaproteobacteria bacterium]|nr:hypothetical protein [Gammaproteobacteria bacterium]